MLNVSNYQRNASQNYSKVLVRMAIINKSTITNAGGGVEKREPSYTVGGNVNWCSYHGKQHGVPQKTKYRAII